MTSIPDPATPGIDLDLLRSASAADILRYSVPDDGDEAENSTSPTLEKYDPEPARDDVRKTIAYWLLGILSGIVVLAFVLLGAQKWLGTDLEQVRSVAELLFTPVVTLLGAVTGFYYAEHRGARNQ